MSARTFRPAAVEARWQKAWADARLFEATAEPGQRKWFGTVPYPYMSGYQHMGFALSFLRAEFQARFQRMLGRNVLFPQAFHATGLPVLGAAQRIAAKDPGETRILKEMGFSDDDIPAFADPHHWFEVFPEATIRDLQSLGAAVDWRRTFLTTSLNPPYDAFVRWQFRRLLEGGYVRLGKHPVIWCPNDRAPIGDHDRLEGEGEVPTEFTVLKFPLRDRFLVAATLRPETVFGQTNLWVDPDVDYVVARVDAETWVLSRTAADKLGDQGRDVEVIGTLAGSLLVGQEVTAPFIRRRIPILPTKFIDPTWGTGIVTSVPSDAPDDWVALRELQRDEEAARRSGLVPERLRSIRPVPIIRTPGWGPLPAVEIVDRMNIAGPDDREKLEEAKQEIYRAGFYEGVMNDACGEFAGQPVEAARDRVRRAMLTSGEASTMWEPSGEVVCRCLTRAIVKVVEDQWFLAYGDPNWKAKAHIALDAMTLYPEDVRKQFHHVIDWLRDWACAHHRGIGTNLPWDRTWVIESLSDSTVYMAYYTVAHILQDGALRSAVPWAQKVDERFFEYVFRGNGDPVDLARAYGVDVHVMNEARREFLYWYPLDLRNTGKGLVQNHMTFCLFNHIALFPQGRWPRAFGINGHVLRSGLKMSKSKGNTWYIRNAVPAYGADATRLMVANAGEGVDDPSLDSDFAESMADRLAAWHGFAVKKHRTRKRSQPVDAWFLSALNRAVADARKAMEAMEYKRALKRGYFDLQSAWEWYTRRGGSPRADILARFVETQTLLLTPFAPHTAEEVWHRIGKEGFASVAPYPEAKPKELDPVAEASEAYLERVIADVRAILRVTGIEPKVIRVLSAPAWKVRLYGQAVALHRENGLAMESLMAAAKEDPGFAKRSKEVAAAAKVFAGSVRTLGRDDLARFGETIDEVGCLRSSRKFLEKVFGCSVEVAVAGSAKVRDPDNKGRQAVPWRPAIVIE